MAINIKFDLAGNPEPPTILLANRNGNILGQLNIDVESIDISDKFNDASEFSFTLYKYVDVKLTNLWDKVVDFKLVYCKEWDTWFEIKVELDESTETIKTVFCTQLEKAELSQLNLYNIEINTEADIERDDYKIGILYDKNDADASILNRLLKDKAPHYSIVHVDSTIAKMQRSFSFDGTSIDDAFQEIEEEIGCVFIYHSYLDENKILRRTISVYDLQQNCNDCGHRGEFTDVCPKCNSKNIKNGYGEDTGIFIDKNELASEGIQLVTDTDSVKNCFKLEGGDDLMTATIRNCNPNGTDYLWYFSDAVKEDMSNELVDKLNSYDNLYKDYYNNHESNLDTNLVDKYNALVEKYKGFYNTQSTCINCDYKGFFEDICPQCGSTNILSGKKLQTIPTTIKGYSNLMNAYYNTIDLALYLESSLMPSIEMSDTSAEEQASLLTATALSPVAVNNEKIESVSLATANSAVLSMAKIIVRSTYKVEVKNSNYDKDTRTWSGNFIVTNYSDENDTAESQTVTVEVNNDTETFVKQKLDKALNKEDADDYSISGLFEKDYDEFCAELKKYAINPLKNFYDSCDVCLNILIDQGAGNKNEKPDLYEQLYEPYYKKSSAISNEIKIRENEISVIEGVWDKTTDEKNPELITKGLQQYIEECRNEIQDVLDFKSYLGEELWLEFCSYRREDTYSNDNYISDGLNNAELFKKAQEFYEVAENEIYKSAELQHSISTSLNNLLAIEKFKTLVDSFGVGNWIRVRVDDKIFKLRLLEYNINFGSFENIPVEFSDVTKIKNGITDVKRVIEQASSMATNYSSIQRQADKGNKAKNTLEQWISDGLNSANVQIQNNDSEEVTLTKNGLLCRSYDEITGTYSPEQLRLTHNIMAYTDDEWKTVRQAIGKHEYKYYDDSVGVKDFVDKIGYGINADFVTAGIVSGSQIIGGNIYSVNYRNKDNDKTGSYLNLTDGTFSFAGGKLTYDGDHLSVDGEVTIATNGTIACWNIDNFSIYKGSNVFGNASGMYFGTEGLSLSDTFKVTSDGEATMTKANITGVINAENGGTIAGFDIGSDSITHITTSDNGDKYEDIYIGVDGINLGQGQFYVTNTGQVVANDGIIGGFTIEKDHLYNGIFGENNSIFLSTTDIEGISGFFEDDITNWRMTIGSNFGVTSNGTLYAGDAHITGGSLTVGSNFGVDTSGIVTCSNAVISGAVSLKTGSSIGLFETDENSIFSGSWGDSGTTPPTVFMCTGSSNSYKIGGSEEINGWVFGAGTSFGVTKDGALYATSGKIGGCDIIDGKFYIANANADGMIATGVDIAGKIVADEGEIGGWKIEYNPLNTIGLNSIAAPTTYGDSYAQRYRVHLTAQGLVLQQTVAGLNYKPEAYITWGAIFATLLKNVKNNHGEHITDYYIDNNFFLNYVD